jgi:ABC-type Mn2+/Zn2+ transport system ATPase subunit
MSATAALIEATELRAGYGVTTVLRELSFAVLPGERIAVLGPNGGGKTTLFRVLLGELEPSAGTLRRPQRCGLVPQTERSRLDFPVSALDVALMGTIGGLRWWRRPGRRERARAEAALAAVGLAEYAGKSFGDLSGGQRQRVLIARAIAQDAPVLLLDEPFTGLDAVSADLLERLTATMASEGRALLIATHDVAQARRWDKVLCLNERQIAFGAPADVLSLEVLEATYGGEIVTLPGTAGHLAEPGRAILPAHHHDHEH